MNTEEVLLDSNLKNVPLFKKGKVREVYDLGDRLLLVATDRISAFDYILPNGIPYKGKVLTGLSAFWFGYTKDIIENHFISADTGSYGEGLEGRAMIVKKTEAFPVECVVRGYLAGSGWKEYKQKGSIGGLRIRPGYKEADRLEEPVFTPATKADSGHDENIDMKRCAVITGKEWAEKLKETSIKLYKKAHEYARQKGIIIADTKFEFGLLDGRLLLIDEALTPDSSRFWPREKYQPGRSQDSFDKQFVRDYLESITWDKQPPVPELPQNIVGKTSRKYLDAYKYITGKELCQ